MLLDKAFLHNFDRNVIGKFTCLPSNIPSMNVSQKNHMTQIDSHLSCDMFNILCCNGPTDLSDISDNINHFRSKKLPYAFWIGFENEPSWLESELQKLGLVTDEMEWAMACDVSNYQGKIDHFDVKKVSSKEGISDLIHVMNQIFPQSEHHAIESFFQLSAPTLLSKDCHLTYFVGYEDGEPVSLASVYFDETIASIFDVIVLPKMRGRGLGKLMTQKGMLEAKSKGFDKCILTATNDAKYLYHKLGFVDVKTMKVYHEQPN